MIYRIKVIIFVVLFGFLNSGLKSQNAPGLPNDQDKNYVPDKTSIFNSDGKNGTKERTSNNSEIHDLIELNPFMLARNIFALQYEHKFGDMFGVQGGLGYCYGKDYMQTIIPTWEDNGGSNIDDATLLTKGVYKGSSLYLSLAARLYFNSYNRYSGDENTGYLEMGIRHYKNSMLMSDSTAITTGGGQGGYIHGAPTADIVTNLYYLNYGYHFATDGKIRTTHHFYFGFGIRNSTYNQFDSYQAYNNSSGNSSTYYVMTPVTKTSVNFVVQCGYELGIAFR